VLFRSRSKRIERLADIERRKQREIDRSRIAKGVAGLSMVLVLFIALGAWWIVDSRTQAAQADIAAQKALQEKRIAEQELARKTDALLREEIFQRLTSEKNSTLSQMQTMEREKTSEIQSLKGQLATFDRTNKALTTQVNQLTGRLEETTTRLERVQSRYQVLEADLKRASERVRTLEDQLKRPRGK
jgi:chromosome segregation ATPase